MLCYIHVSVDDIFYGKYWHLIDRLVQQVVLQQKKGIDPDSAPVPINVDNLIQQSVSKIICTTYIPLQYIYSMALKTFEIVPKKLLWWNISEYFWVKSFKKLLVIIVYRVVLCRLLREDEVKAIQWEAEEVKKEKDKVSLQLRKKEWERDSLKMERYGKQHYMVALLQCKGVTYDDISVHFPSHSLPASLTPSFPFSLPLPTPSLPTL